MAASASLLATKLYIPPARANRVSRPRLIQRLADGLTHSLTLISAPAGFGKTTLLSEWHASDTGRTLPLAWLSLDDDDNAPPRFLAHVIAALQTVCPTLGETALALLQATPPSPLHAMLASLINDVAAVSTPFRSGRL